MRNAEVTPIGAVARGIAAGMLGTAVFTAYQTGKSLLTGGGGGSAPPRRWADVPAPAQVGRRFVEDFLHRRATLKDVPALMQIMHWGYGVGWGAVYGLVHESLEPRPLVHGAALGVAVVGADYTLLPVMKLYDPPWEYSPKELGADLGNHLVFGLAVAGSYALLERKRNGRATRLRRLAA